MELEEMLYKEFGPLAEAILVLIACGYSVDSAIQTVICG